MTSLLQYKIIENLGKDEFTTTLIAEDKHSPGSGRCVIKQYPLSSYDEQTRKIIDERLSKTLATLKEVSEATPQIPAIYNYFTSEDKLYIVQEWIEGESLASLTQKQGALSEKTVTIILNRLLILLSYLHGQGIIHQAIEPDNIMLRQGDGLPILINFGTIKAILETKLTPSGNYNHSFINASPEFIPPEQAKGQVGKSSDLYSLGLTAICLLTGKRPKRLKTDLMTGEILWKDEVKVSNELARVLDKAIQSHPGDRYQSAKQMRTDLIPPETEKQERFSRMDNEEFKETFPYWLKMLLLVSTLTITVLGTVQFFWVQSKQQKLAQEKEKIEQKQQQPISEKPIEKQTENQPTPIPPQTKREKLPVAIKPSPIPSPQTQTQQVNPQSPVQQTNPNNTQELVVSLPPAVPQNINLTLQNKSYISNKMAPKSIALTFDDGPDMIYTPQILDKLKEHGIKATFFIVGKRLAEPGGCEIVQRMALEGHEIANHTYDHLFLSKMTPAQQREEIQKTQQALEQCIPGYKMQWLRASYGDQNKTTLQVANELGLNTILWTIDTNDWRQSSTIGSITNVATSTNGQDVILMHSATEVNPKLGSKLASNSRENTVNALDNVITNLQGRGMTFMTLSEAFSQQQQTVSQQKSKR